MFSFRHFPSCYEKLLRFPSRCFPTFPFAIFLFVVFLFDVFHQTRIIYHPTIQYTHDYILGWWCGCYIGSRFIGCCSHISSAIWFLSCERWKMQQRQMPSGSYMGLATDAIQVSDFYDSSDDDDTRRYSLL